MKSFFGLGKSNNKSQQVETIKVYLEYTFKHHVKNLQMEESSTCEQVLSQIKKQLPNPHFDQETVTFIILLVCPLNSKKDNRHIICQRKLDASDMPLKIMKQRSEFVEYYFLFQEMPVLKMNEMKQYHFNLESKYNAILRAPQEQYGRFGTLLKRSKTGQFRERYFKLMKDCITYYRDKDKNVIERLQKEKNVFLLRVDQKVYTLKANSKTDYEGWIYSIHKQSLQFKESKLFSDYDKKIHLMQKSKMDYYKNLATNSALNLKHLINSSPTILEKFIIKRQVEFEILLFDLLQLIYDKKKNEKNGKNESLLQGIIKSLNTPDVANSFIQFLGQKKPQELTKLKSLIESINPELELIQSILSTYGVPFIELGLYQEFKRTGQFKWIIARLPVKRFQNFIQFPLPDFSMFWHDLYETSPSKRFNSAMSPSFNNVSQSVVQKEKEKQVESEVYTPKNEIKS